MSDPAASSKNSDTKKNCGPAVHESAPGSGRDATLTGADKDLTPEEQMALYEKHLKENDWGHQPC